MAVPSTRMQAQGEYLAPGSVLSSGAHSITVLAKIAHGGFGVTYRVRNNVSFSLPGTGKVIYEGETLVLKEIFARGRMERKADGFVVMSDGSDPQQQFQDFLEELGAYSGRSSAPGLVHNFPAEMRGDMERMGAVPIYHAMLLRTRSDSSKFIYAFLMPYISGGQLRDYMTASACSLSAASVVNIFYKLLCTLTYMHNDGGMGRRRFIHRDISPNNVMLTEGGSPILIDYGLTSSQNAKFINAANLKYASPEQRGSKDPRPEQDLFSLGATFFRLIAGSGVSQDLYLDDLSLAERFRILNSAAEKLDGFRSFCSAYEANFRSRTGRSYQESNRFGNHSFAYMFVSGIALSLQKETEGSGRRWKSATEWLNAVFQGVPPSGLSGGSCSAPQKESRSRSLSAEVGERLSASVKQVGQNPLRTTLWVLILLLLVLIATVFVLILS